MADPRKPGEPWNPNPTGKGGLGDRPHDINRGGKTSEQKLAEQKAAHELANARARMGKALNEKLDELEADNKKDEILALVTPAILRLITDAEDRAFGKPKQSVDVESPKGTMSPKDVDPTAVAALASKLTGD